MPTDIECAAFALDVYRDELRPMLPEGWRCYADYVSQKGDGDYFAACYIGLKYRHRENRHSER